MAPNVQGEGAMQNDKKKEDEKPQHPPLKPANPDIKGAPNDHDREAQYEDKDES